jgi:lauroyl/myristoyl acyltransferase
LFLTFHGGFVIMARKLFATLFRDGVSIQNHRSRANFSAKLDPAAALFNALRALQEGKSVIMSPDGPYGKHSCAMHVLGRTAEMADGAAFLAYEAKCETAWFTVVRDDSGFRPDIQVGPRREDGERYKQFQQRLCDFYGERIAALYSGDPRNIALSRRWVDHLITRDVDENGDDED